MWYLVNACFRIFVLSHCSRFRNEGPSHTEASAMNSFDAADREGVFDTDLVYGSIR